MPSKLEALYSILSSLKIPVAYDHFNTEQNLPYIAFVEERSDNTFADNIVYFENSTVNIELYTEYKDESLEDDLKTLLSNYDYPYQKTLETRMDEEGLYEVVYTITI